MSERDSRAAQALRAEIERRGRGGVRAIAREFDVDAGQLSRWARGVAKPDAPGRGKLIALGIEFPWWEEDPLPAERHEEGGSGTKEKVGAEHADEDGALEQRAELLGGDVGDSVGELGHGRGPSPEVQEDASWAGEHGKNFGLTDAPADEVTPAEAPEAKRLSSRPPPAADAFDEESTTVRDPEPVRHVPPVKFSEREQVETDPDPRAGEELAPSPKPLTALDVRVPERVYELDDEDRTPTPNSES